MPAIATLIMQQISTENKPHGESDLESPGNHTGWENDLTTRFGQS